MKESLSEAETLQARATDAGVVQGVAMAGINAQRRIPFFPNDLPHAPRPDRAVGRHGSRREGRLGV